LIRAAQTSHYWAKADEDSFDELTAKLGPLMKFREQNNGGTGQVNLDLTDILHIRNGWSLARNMESVSITRYREMVENLITELTEHNPILSKNQERAEHYNSRGRRTSRPAACRTPTHY